MIGDSMKTNTEPKNSTMKYNIWKCISCPNECILPFSEPYDNPHVCPSNRDIEADFRHEEICESDLLSKFLRVAHKKVEDSQIQNEQYLPGIYDGFDTVYIDDIGNFSGIQSVQYPTPIKLPFINTPLGKHYLTDYNPWVKTVRLRKLWDKMED